MFEVQFTSGGFGWVVVPAGGGRELAELTFEAWRLTAPRGADRPAGRQDAPLSKSVTERAAACRGRRRRALFGRLPTVRPSAACRLTKRPAATSTAAAGRGPYTESVGMNSIPGVPRRPLASPVSAHTVYLAAGDPRCCA